MTTMVCNARKTNNKHTISRELFKGNN